ncbi:hypothetical protein KIPB_001605 [Kipferlia bialata]|uniref:Uncharacterized protein n=1 Tax=Kipferlia bialata TaxID=797122 RepID=A0A391NIV0_9EUKA|nr:hypothetical protein KIPB_001605 [Kipferlia bialata]|eukprot:g1605.t1
MSPPNPLPQTFRNPQTHPLDYPQSSCTDYPDPCFCVNVWCQFHSSALLTTDGAIIHTNSAVTGSYVCALPTTLAAGTYTLSVTSDHDDISLETTLVLTEKARGPSYVVLVVLLLAGIAAGVACGYFIFRRDSSKEESHEGESGESGVTVDSSPVHGVPEAEESV